MAKSIFKQSVVQPWVAKRCTYKMQTVLLCSLRGCDGMPKEDLSKKMTRCLRHCVLYSAEDNPKAKFISGDNIDRVVDDLTEDLDHYPLHWIAHVMHACEIIGFKHDSKETRELWTEVYRKFAEAFHLLPETVHHLDLRLADKEYSDDDKKEYRNLCHLPPPVEVRVVYKDPPKQIASGARVSSGGGYRG